MKNKSIGMIAGIFGMLSAQTGMRKANSNVNPSTSRNPSTQKNRPSRTTKWRTSSPSEYFGQRSNPVTAKLPNGTIKQMKLKNALKKNAEIIW